MSDKIRENLHLILEEVDEVIGVKNLESLLEENKKVNMYWGTTPSRLPHFLYLLPLIKIKKFTDLGIPVKILLADIHAYLDSNKSNFEVLAHRTDIHETIIKFLLRSLNTDMSMIYFIQGTSFQVYPDYIMDLFKINGISRVSEVKAAGAYAVIQSEDPLMTSLLYPTLQALDIQHTKSDIFFGDSNQREICRFADKTLCKLGYNKRTYFLNEFNDVIKGLNNISFLDSYEKIKEKIYSFKFSVIIELFETVIYEICEIKKIDIIINNIKHNKIEDLGINYKENKINKENIYDFVIEIINDINEPIRIEFNEIDVKEKLAAADY
jgi:tyrosyl-tRNA synthetase